MPGFDFEEFKDKLPKDLGEKFKDMSLEDVLAIIPEEVVAEVMKAGMTPEVIEAVQKALAARKAFNEGQTKMRETQEEIQSAVMDAIEAAKAAQGALSLDSLKAALPGIAKNVVKGALTGPQGAWAREAAYAQVSRTISYSDKPNITARIALVALTDTKPAVPSALKNGRLGVLAEIADLSIAPYAGPLVAVTQTVIERLAEERNVSYDDELSRWLKDASEKKPLLESAVRRYIDSKGGADLPAATYNQLIDEATEGLEMLFAMVTDNWVREGDGQDGAVLEAAANDGRTFVNHTKANVTRAIDAAHKGGLDAA